MNSNPSPSIIKSFSIYGLFGTQNVHINFDGNIKVIIGENGLGKTQVLNIFYYLLTYDLKKLNNFFFERINISLRGQEIKITKKELLECFGQPRNINPVEKEIIRKIGSIEFRELRQEARYLTSKDLAFYLENEPIYQKLLLLASSLEIANVIKYGNTFGRRRKRSRIKYQLNDNLIENEIIVRNHTLNKIILYFPTFRRVEEDLYNLGFSDEWLYSDGQDDRLINFGMDDVQKRFNALETKIDSLLKEGFTKISSEILSKLVKGFGNTNKKVLDKISDADLDIILARVGDQLSKDEKLKIREIVANKEASNTDNSLFYFIQALVDIYEKQKEFDLAINKFKQVCNNYLINKKVVYDESNIKIYIKSEATNEPLALNKLSSGEKQIISIFSKIYLSESNQRFIVLFDEPELSLSMLWQKQLLPDIVNSNKCDFLLAVTHSPFIFDNELDRYAVGLNEYVTPIREVTS